MEQQQKQKTPAKQVEEVPESEAKDLRDEELSAAVEELLDEIDDLLEPDAETFVKEYVQRGGE